MNRATLSIVAVLVAFAGTLSSTNSVSGATIPLDDFSDLMGSPPQTQNIQMATGDNLMFDDGVTTQSVGLDGSYWHAGFVDYDGGNIYIVGWAKNPLPTTSGWEGWLQGRYSSDLGNFDPDGVPDDLYLVHDQDSDGIGVLDGGNLILGPDDIFYTADDVLFGAAQIRGDLSQLPAYGGDGILPSMTVSPVVVPAPATGSAIAVLLSGMAVLRRVRRR